MYFLGAGGVIVGDLGASRIVTALQPPERYANLNDLPPACAILVHAWQRNTGAGRQARQGDSLRNPQCGSTNSGSKAPIGPLEQNASTKKGADCSLADVGQTLRASDRMHGQNAPFLLRSM